MPVVRDDKSVSEGADPAQIVPELCFFRLSVLSVVVPVYSYDLLL